MLEKILWEQTVKIAERLSNLNEPFDLELHFKKTFLSGSMEELKQDIDPKTFKEYGFLSLFNCFNVLLIAFASPSGTNIPASPINVGIPPMSDPITTLLDAIASVTILG